MSKERAGSELEDAARKLRQAAQQENWEEARAYLLRAARDLDSAGTELKRD
jgi:aspartate/glutamate racemase